MSDINNKKEKVQFEGRGIFLGLISYPFYLDGKELYTKIFKPFFDVHKKALLKYDPVAETGDDYGNLYKPAGYRMFGSKGLAVLSLVDDYSFCNRFFNKNHIQSVLNDDKDFNRNNNLTEKKKDKFWEKYLKFKSEVVLGVVENHTDKEPSIDDRANYFLKDNPKKFIGIARLKINYDILKGKGLKAVWKIKNRIDKIHNKKESLNYFVMDCYDNDEMTVLAFSDNLMSLFNFLGNIRSITNHNIGISKNGKEKHVFGLSYLCFGYKIYNNKDISFSKKDKKYYLNCTVETKPGHRDVFYNKLKEEYLKTEESQKNKSFNIESLSTNISGGSTVSFSFPINKISVFEKLCRDEKGFIYRDARNIKVSLKDLINDDESKRELAEINENHEKTNNYDKKAAIDRKYFADVKKNMKEVGVSKIVRERLLALMEFYNLSYQNILQQAYLEELKPVFLKTKTILEEMGNNPQEDLNSIENALNEIITDLENACYDRLHTQKNGFPPLEYSGGIQQHLTSFDFAYKQIYNSFFSSSDQDKPYYLTISGAERASSKRIIFNLNINDILFPEMFIVLVWKEIANFANPIQKTYDTTEEDAEFKKKLELYNTWNAIISKKQPFSVIQERFEHSDKMMHGDDTWETIKSLFYEKNLVEYFIKDWFVFRFAFGTSYQLLWHFYLKIFLQTTTVYSKLNHVDNKHLILMLLRLFMIAKLSGDKESKKIVEENEKTPFDSIIGPQWIECYKKTLDATDEIYTALEMFDFKKMVGTSIDNSTKLNSNNRETIIDYILNYLDKEIIQEDKSIMEKIDFLPNLFIAYLFATYLLDNYLLDNDEETDNLDNNEKTKKRIKIKCMPRESTGIIYNKMELDKDENRQNSIRDIYNCMIKIPVDPTGGFFIPSHKTREAYFALRTVFYRSLWNYRFVCAENTEQKNTKEV